MKKIVIVILVAVALLLLLAPGAVGVMAENHFRKISANAASAAPGLRWSVQEYERGWFSSTARYRLQIDAALLTKALDDEGSEHGEAPVLPVLESQAEIFHGPIFFAAWTREGVSMAPALAHSVDNVTLIGPDGEAAPAPGDISTRLGLFGRHTNTVDIGKVTMPLDEDGQTGTATWTGMKMDTRFTSSLDDLEFIGQIGSFELNMPHFQLRTGELLFDGNQRRTSYGFWAGRQNGSFGGMHIAGGDQGVMSMGKMTWDATISVADEQVTEDVILAIDRIEFAGWQGGPIRLSGNVSGLDAVALGEIAQTMQDLAMQPGMDTAQMSAALPLLSALLAAGPELTLRELSFGTPDGAVSITARLSFPATEPAALGAFILGLDGTVNLRMPEALTNRLAVLNPNAHAQIQGLISAGLLMRSDDYLVMDAALKGGLLTVNGQPMPVPLAF